MKGEQLLGTLTIAGETATIRDGKVKVKDRTFSFKAAIEGADVTFNGRLNGEEVRLTPEGMGRTVTLKRAK